MRLKKILALLLTLALILSINPLSAFAEELDDEDFSGLEIEDDSLDLSDDAADDTVVIVGTVDFPPFTMYTGEVLYTGKVVLDCSLRSEMNMDSSRVVGIPKNATIEILDVYADWLLARYNGKTGYAKRLWMYKRPEAVDKENTPPYGVYRYNYIATCNGDTPIQKAPGDGQEAYLTLHEGAKIAIIDVYEGWGRFFYWHGYGYVDMSKLRDLIDVSPTDAEMGNDCPIAAYTSYYSIATNEANIGRMKNIAVGSERISRVYQPGEFYDCNKQMGPFRKSTGYFKAPVLVDGGSALGYGGGTCQVSSTLFNVLLQLPGVTVVHRNAHTQSGAKYLPIGNDAAVGTDRQNLQFQNDYPFPIRLEATSQDGALTMVMYRAD